MVGTPPYQKRGKCGHWMPAFDKHLRCYSCRMHCKGEDPCASGAPLEACSACSALTEVEWNHLRTVFHERSAKRASKNLPADPEPEDEDPEAREIDDSILDLNTEDSGTGTTGYVSPTGVSAPAGLSPLQSTQNLPSSGIQFVQPSVPPPRSAAFLTVPTTSTVFFKTPAPPKATIQQDPMFSSAPDPQRLVPPPTPRTQMLKAHFEQQNLQMMENLSQRNQKQMLDLSSQLQSGLQQFLTSSMEEMFKKFSPTPSDSSAPQPSAQAQPSQVVQTQPNQPVPTPPEPMDTSFHQTVKKGLKGVKGSASIAQATKAVVSPTLPSPTQPPTQSESPLQRLEKGDYGLESGSSYSSASQVDDSEPENLAPPPKADFHAFIDRVRQYLGIDDPAKTEDYKLGSGLGRDPNMFRMEQSSRPPSLKLPLMDDIAKLLQNQDTVVKPGPASSTSLDIGQFVPNPPNRGNWYPVAGERFEQRPQVVPQAFSNIARPGYKGLPTASINQRELVKLELMVRECIATSNFLSTLSTASESTLNNLRAARDQREKTFGLLASDPDPNNRDQFLHQLLTSTVEDTPQMQFMLDISRSTAVAYQHLLEKFLHLLTNLVLIRRDSYLKNAHNSLDSYRLKNLRAAPISGPDLFERSLMQEYEQHLIGLGVKTGNQQSTRFHPYGKQKKKPRGRGRGAYQQGGYYQMPPPQYVMPPQFYPQQQPHRGGFRGSNKGRGARRGRGKNISGNQSQQQTQNQ